MKKVFKISLIAILLSVFMINGSVSQDKFSNKKDTINIVVSEDIIEGVNKLDAQAAMALTMKEMLTDEFKHKTELIKPDIVSSIREIKELIKKNKADVIGLFTLDYIKYKEEMFLEPIFIVEREANTGSIYLFLTRSDSQINSLSDLYLKRVLTYNSREEEIIEKWLYVEMKKEEINDPLIIINNFTKIPTPTKRVFPVFFGKADACIVSKVLFESMCELNPQLKKQLKVLLESPPFITHVFSRNTKSKKYGVVNSRQYALESGLTENGNKLLKLFKAIKVTNFKASYLESVDSLLIEYDKYISE